ncbi:efflux RND transporter permease subunit [Engelhardtia mirabilis]|uniref:Cobalt-zinc-cadmium resistance protein CzcA n=1 Tax=Engelhardtia mirabilis TaxID=2528011 RepID=A0A518BPZ1_9BACT|nr:Cobalt-zinc-cadmium resistance protein CzcA [Planctomycetes bacterium Pla133]QDV03364.1 Cobalt-zinc-cadmium resistance protein CzcA [Planctomycetes bacterium Pla86]
MSPSPTTPAGEPRGALAFVTRRPVAITMLMLSLGVFGVVSFFKLSQDLLPEISYPTLTVRTSWPGSAPEDVEQRISTRIQEALNALPGVVRSSSTSRAGVSDVLLEYTWGTPMTFAVQDVREQLDGVFLPDGAERPLILRYDPNLDPVLRIGMTSSRGNQYGASSSVDTLIQLRWLAENRIKRELEAIEGVAAVQVRGGLEEEIHVAVDPFQLAARDIDPSELATRLAQENVNASGGALREGSTEYIVRTVNEFLNLEEIADLAIAERGESVVRVRDVARVERTYKKREVVSRIDGAEAVELAIYREAGANIVTLAERVRTTLFGTEEQQQKAQEFAGRGGDGGMTLGDRDETNYLAFRNRDTSNFTLLSDQSTFIEDAVNDVQQAAVLGAIFAVLVIWTFLRRLAPTVIIALAIPISVVVTFAPMYLSGVTLNIMSLGGLALGVGMLVDNAIVVLESITRCREEGDCLNQAAVRGTREVAGAVTASTLTTVSVFAPIVFVSGVAGQIFGDQALTVVTALSVSLIVAVLFIPMLASRPWLAGGQSTERAPLPSIFAGLDWRGFAIVGALAVVVGRTLLWIASFLLRVVAGVIGAVWWVLSIPGRVFSRAFEVVWGAVERGYEQFVRGALALPVLVLLAVGAIAWHASQRASNLGVELLPEIHQGEFTAFVQLYVGTPLETTDGVLDGLAKEIALLDGVATTAATAGVEEDTLTRDVEGPHTGRLTVRMDADAVGVEAENALADHVRDLVRDHPAVRSVEIRRPTPFALEAPIAIEVRGHDLERLGEVSEEVRERISALDSVADMRSSLRPGFPEVRVTFDRDKTLEYGLDLASVSTLVRDQVLGNISTRFTRGDDRIDVRVIADDKILATLADVMDLVINPSSPRPVPLSAVADVQTVQGPAEIRRIGNSRAVVLEAETRGLDLGATASLIEAELRQMPATDGVVVELGGQKREMDEAQSSMRFALILAIFLVYVVMAAQFESLLQPLVILLTVPLAGVGVVYTLEALSIPLSVVVFIGLIMLAGIVVNNAIVLVDRINQNRGRGLELHEAIVEAGRARLRPILMTTATTALGLLPMTGWLEGLPLVGELGSGEGAELRAPMAIAVITGLVASTLLTLLVIPTVYSLVARLEGLFVRNRTA